MSSPRPPLTLEQLQLVVAGISYRPGWVFSVEVDPFEGSMGRIVGPVEDAYHPGRTIDLGITSYLPPMYSAEDVVEWVTWRMGRIASHEMREWLCWYGRRVADPHAAA